MKQGKSSIASAKDDSQAQKFVFYHHTSTVERQCRKNTVDDTNRFAPTRSDQVIEEKGRSSLNNI
jgi:hypothetical protein